MEGFAVMNVPVLHLYHLLYRMRSRLLLRRPDPGMLRILLARQFIQGQGIEIGALDKPLTVPAGVRVTYVDRLDMDGLRRHYPNLSQFVTVDRIDDGETLATFADASQDFIIANHFLEHAQNPIGTLERHLQVLLPGGILYLAVPDQRWTFDRRRPLTSLEHLYHDYLEGPEGSYLAHVREWAELVDGRLGAALEDQVCRLAEMGFSIHYHVWTHETLLHMLADIRARLQLPFQLRAACVNRPYAETICVLERL